MFQTLAVETGRVRSLGIRPCLVRRDKYTVRLIQGKSRKVRSAVWPNRIGREAYSAVGPRLKAGSGKEVRWAIEPDFILVGRT